jgi:hypothetical protein
MRAPPKIPFHNIIRLRKNQVVPNIYDVDIAGIEQLKTYDHVEYHLVLYPYSRKVCSDDITFYPFEEYVKDVLSRQRSAYAEIHSHFNEIFGLLLGLMIALVFARFKPEELLSIESVVSVFGAYAIGKEVWGDIEQVLINLTKSWPIRFQDNYYRYRLEKHTTLTYYSYLAKRRRYGKSSLIPEKIDFIKQSNSQTLRLCFNLRDLRSFRESSAHVHSIHIEPDLLADFQESGFMFGVKLSFNKTFLGISSNFEVFQSIDRHAKGCLDDRGRWIDGAIFYRKTLTLGRIKWYLRKGFIHGEPIIEAACTDSVTR